MKCSQCGGELSGQDRRPGAMSGSVMGDEYTYTYYFCAACQVYTVESYRDRFCGPDEIRIQGPISKAKGDAILELAAECSRPWDKKCRCAAHRKYFGSGLD